MEWSDLRIFLGLVRAGSFEAAAPGLGVSAATVARRLRALEAALGQRLLQRGPAGLRTSDEGQLLLESALVMEAQALRIQQRLQGVPAQAHLRVSAPDWFAQIHLSPVLARLARECPHLTVELSCERRYLSLTRHEADVALRIRPFDEPDVVARRLLVNRYAVYQRRGLPRPAADGAGSTLLALTRDFQGPPDDSWLALRLPAARVLARADSRLLQAQLCALGLGLAVLPQTLGDARTELQRVDLGSPPPARELWQGYHRDLARQPRLRAWNAALRAEFGTP